MLRMQKKTIELIASMKAYDEFYKWAVENKTLQEESMEVGIDYTMQELIFFTVKNCV